MSQKIARPPPDESELPSAVSKQMQQMQQLQAPLRKSTSLDAILMNTNSQYGDKTHYRVDLAYRLNPRYNPKSPHAVTISKGTGRSSPLSPACSPACSPRSPRPVRFWGSPVVGASLVKSRSLPTIAPSDDEAGPSFGIASRPQCSASSTGMCNLQRNADSAMVCVYCGTQASGVAMIEQERAKNCPKRDDCTQVGEACTGSAAQASCDAWAHGPEALEDRQRRIGAWAGGAHISQKTARRMEFQQVANMIGRTAWKGARKDIEGDAREELARRKIIDLLEIVFVQVENLHKEVEKHVRLETIRLYAASMRHEAVCKQAGCMLSLSQRSSMAVAYSVTEFVLTSLHKAGIGRIAELTGGTVSLEQIKEKLSKVKQLQLVPSGHSQLQQVTSAIGLIARWGPHDACKPCQQAEDAPSELMLPPSIAQSMNDYGKVSKADPGDVTPRMRLQLESTAKLTSTRGDVRDAALTYLAVSEVVRFLTLPEHQLWSIQLLACLLLYATACKIDRLDSTENLRENLLESESVRPKTFLTSAMHLNVLMDRFPPPKSLDSEDDLYACE